jgi:release factor glutamine methyltransferase
MKSEEVWLLEEKYGGNKTAEYLEDLKRLTLGEPLAYIIGWQPFNGLRIYLDSKPLIPRVETEWWTNDLIAELKKRSGSFTFLDLCAGSGAIGCAVLKQLPQAQVYFGEVDPAHETTIRKNIRENGLDESRAHICIGDLFEYFGKMRFDVIASNPPYVPSNRELPASVALYEPSLALTAGPDGLDVLRRIAHDLPAYLSPGGVSWIECDREHAEATRTLFEEKGLSAHIRTDQYEKPRFVVVSLP